MSKKIIEILKKIVNFLFFYLCYGLVNYFFMVPFIYLIYLILNPWGDFPLRLFSGYVISSFFIAFVLLYLIINDEFEFKIDYFDLFSINFKLTYRILYLIMYIYFIYISFCFTDTQLFNPIVADILMFLSFVSIIFIYRKTHTNNAVIEYREKNEKGRLNTDFLNKVDEELKKIK
jgi:hypothetical protein